MSETSTYRKIKEAVDLIKERSQVQPRIGMVLGSGLGTIADDMEKRVTISYSEIPNFHGTSVEGHAGELVTGNFEGIPAVVLKGRFHLYEGYPMEDVVFPTRVICALGIEKLVLTNAAGGINTRFKPCDLMIIEDHINLMGDNPLKGPNLKELGPRFPDMTEAYHQEGVEVIEEAARSLNLEIRKGVYAGVLGPTYETPAEIRMLRTLGADAVGMSTVTESIAANHLGVRVVGISCITNPAAGISPNKLTHAEVVDNSKISAEKLTRLLKKSVPHLVSQKKGR